jgi:hypothetical protein
MLIKLLFCCIYCFIAYHTGLFYTQWSQKKFRENILSGFFETVLAGSVLLTLLALLLNLFIPVNQYTAAGIIVCVLLLRYKKIIPDSRKALTGIASGWKRLNNFQKVIAMLAMLIFLLYLSLPILFGDSYLYHLQAIEATEKYRAVPGIGNINERLGFNKGYFALQALFACGQYFDAPVIFLNGVLSTLFLLSCLRLLQQNIWLVIAAVVLYYCLLRFYLVTYSSPSTDLATSIVYLYVFYKCAQQKALSQALLSFILLLTAWAFSIKASGVFLCLVPVIIYRKQIFKASFRPLFLPFLLAALLVLITVAHVYITSGYFIYPYLTISSIQPDYTVPAVIAQLEKNSIAALIKQGSLHANPGLTDWIPSWFRITLTQKTEWPFVALFLAGIGSCIPWLFNQRAAHRHGFRIWLAAYVLMLIFYFLSPQFRFFIPFNVVCLWIPASLFLRKNNRYTGLAYLPPLILFAYLVTGFCTYTNALYRQHFLAVPFSVINPKDKQKAIQETPAVNFFNRPFYLDNADRPVHQLFGLDCIHYYLPGIEARGSSFADGFNNSYFSIYNQGVVPDSLKTRVKLPQDFFDQP